MKKLSEKIFFFGALCGMACSLVGCAALPSVMNDVEQIADDTAIKISVSREAITKNTDVKAFVILDNVSPK